MRKGFLLGIAFALLPLGAQAANDTLIVAGVRVGNITRDTSEADLIEKLKPEEYKRGMQELGEGFGRRALILYPGTAKEMSIVWKSDRRQIAPRDWASAGTAPVVFDKPDFITITHAGSAWHTKEGVTVGTTLAVMRKLNGKDFEFAGFAWEYPGRIYSWHDGNIPTCLGVSFAVKDAEHMDGLPKGEDDVNSDSEIIQKYAKDIFVGTVFAAFPEVYGGHC